MIQSIQHSGVLEIQLFQKFIFFIFDVMEFCIDIICILKKLSTSKILCTGLWMCLLTCHTLRPLPDICIIKCGSWVLPNNNRGRINSYVGVTEKYKGCEGGTDYSPIICQKVSNKSYNIKTIIYAMHCMLRRHSIFTFTAGRVFFWGGGDFAHTK